MPQPDMPPDDEALLAEFGQRRDESSFRQLYRRHTPRLFALGVRLCGSRAEAEELTQETWVRAVERHDTFDHRSRYSTWLSGILINCFREAARRKTRWPRALDENGERAATAVIAGFPPTAQMPADPIDVERALGRLPDGYREVVILHDLHGHTHAEIAEMLGIRDGTSKSQLQRGRARLRDLLREKSPADRNRGERGTS